MKSLYKYRVRRTLLAAVVPIALLMPTTAEARVAPSAQPAAAQPGTPPDNDSWEAAAGIGDDVCFAVETIDRTSGCEREIHI